jgi:protein-disulfide isomerase
VLGDLPGRVWFFDDSHAFTGIIYDNYSIARYIKEEITYMKKPVIVLFSIGILIFLYGLGVSLYRNQQIKNYGFMAHKDASTFVREYSQTLGSDDAKVYLVKFSDPACETCSAFHPFIKNMMAHNKGKIKLVIRYAPFHTGADYFVKILEAAKKQGKYWETLDIMYKSQGEWASHHKPKPDLIWKFLPRAGLDLDRIRKDMQDPEITKIIQQDLADAKTLNVRKTPGFFVNGKPLPSFGYEQLQRLVESEINKFY